MIRDHQNRMAHCHQSFLFAAASSDAMILRTEVLILGARSTMRGFDQAMTQPRATFACAPGAPLTRRFVIPRTHPRPRRQMPGASKTAHITTGFCPQDFCRAPAHAGNGVQPPQLLLNRAQSLLDLLAAPFDRSFEI